MKLLLVVLVSLLALKCFCDSSSATISKSIEINEKNWEELLSSGEWMVEFFAPWCPACNRFQSTWDEFALKQEQLNIRVGSADVNANPVLSGLFSVTSLPTIYHIKDGQYRIYHGPRDLLQLVDYIRNNEWKKTEPSSAWLAPNSVLIKALSILFKMTIYFKDVYTKLTETYGYPVWAVLTLFVIVTIILGLLLGIFFIILIDCLCPPKRPTSDELKEMPGDDVLEEKEGDEKEGESSKSKSDKSGDNKDLKNRKKAKKDQ